MEIKTFLPDGYFGSNSYLLISDGEALIIDPSVHFMTVSNAVDTDISFKYIVLTHPHFDHMWYIDEWKEMTGATVIVGAQDAPALTDSYVNGYKLFLGKDVTYDGDFTAVKEGDVLTLGNEKIRIIDTPGHTAGSISLRTSDSVFVGDTVFSKTSIGRTDLPGGDYTKLLESIKKIISLPKDTKVYPGHGESTTVHEIIN